MFDIVERDPANLEIITSYISTTYGGDMEENISTARSLNRAITFKPSVFQVPDGGTEPDLVAVMSPSAAEFEPVFQSI